MKECSNRSHAVQILRNPATLEPMVFPDPVISIAMCQPIDKAGTEKLGVAMGKMDAKKIHPSALMTDEESGETILKGNG